jgi:hypothetical protein
MNQVDVRSLIPKVILLVGCILGGLVLEKNYILCDKTFGAVTT